VGKAGMSNSANWENLLSIFWREEIELNAAM